MELTPQAVVLPPRILHLISSSGFLGAENVLLELADQTRCAGFPVTIGVFLNSANPNRELMHRAEARGHDLVTIPCDGRYDRRVIACIRELLLEKQVNIVHSHNFKSNFYAWRSIAGGRAKWIVTNHGRRSGFKLCLYNSLDKVFVRRADCIVAVSGKIAGELENYGISRNHIRRIDNGVDVERFASASLRKEVRDSLGIPSGRRVVAAIGSLTREKGHAFLLRAIKRIAKGCEDTVFLFVGDGGESRLLQDLAMKLCIEDKVHFAGSRSDVADILPHLALFVLPSLSEGLPMALLEAMSAGVPVVATSVGEVPSVVQQGETGMLVSPGDDAALADAIVQCLSNTDAAREMGRRGSNFVRQHFSSAGMSAHYLDLYREIIAGKQDIP
jgi:glycosyltransferase involved in cell wall biosynthesis